QKGDKIIKGGLCNICAENDRKSKQEKKLKNKSTDEAIFSFPSNEKTLANEDSSESSDDELIYEACDFEEFVASKFRDDKDIVEFFIMVEIKRELVNSENLSLESDPEEAIKFHRI
ncbi:16193_t:CDS:1, partial [Racocetra persica]